MNSASETAKLPDMTVDELCRVIRIKEAERDRLEAKRDRLEAELEGRRNGR